MRPFNPQAHKAPDTFNLRFQHILREGEGGPYAYADTPRFTRLSFRNQFRRFIQTVRHTPGHEGFTQAVGRTWHWCESGDKALWWVVSKEKLSQIPFDI